MKAHMGFETTDFQFYKDKFQSNKPLAQW